MTTAKKGWMICFLFFVLIFAGSTSFVSEGAEEAEPVLSAPLSAMMGQKIEVSVANLTPNRKYSVVWKPVSGGLYGCSGTVKTGDDGSGSGRITLPTVRIEHQGLGTLQLSIGSGRKAFQAFTLVKAVLEAPDTARIGHEIEISAKNLPPKLQCMIWWYGQREGAYRCPENFTTTGSGSLSGRITFPVVGMKHQDNGSLYVVSGKYLLAGDAVEAVQAEFSVQGVATMGHEIEVSAEKLPPEMRCTFTWEDFQGSPYLIPTKLTTDADGSLSGRIKLPVIPMDDQGLGSLYVHGLVKQQIGKLAGEVVEIEEVEIEAAGIASMGEEIEVSAQKLPPDFTCQFFWQAAKGYPYQSPTKLTSNEDGNLQGQVILPVVRIKDQGPGSLYIRGLVTPGDLVENLAGQPLEIQQAVLTAPGRAYNSQEIGISAQKLPPETTCYFTWKHNKGVAYQSPTKLTTDSDGSLEGKIRLTVVREDHNGLGSLYVQGIAGSSMFNLAEDALEIEPVVFEVQSSASVGLKINVSARILAPHTDYSFRWDALRGQSYVCDGKLTADGNGLLSGWIQLPANISGEDQGVGNLYLLNDDVKVVASRPLTLDTMGLKAGKNIIFRLANWGARGDNGVSPDLDSLSLEKGNSVYFLKSRSVRGGLNVTPGGNGTVWAAVGVKFEVEGGDSDLRDATVTFIGTYEYELVAMLQATSTVKLTAGIMKIVQGLQPQPIVEVNVFSPQTLTTSRDPLKTGNPYNVTTPVVRLNEGEYYISFLRMECQAEATVGDALSQLSADFTSIAIDF